jgi:ribosomal protein L29
MTSKVKKGVDLSLKRLDELMLDLENGKKELFALRYSAAASDLKDVSLFKKCKKNVARIKTFISTIMKRQRND